MNQRHSLTRVRHPLRYRRLTVRRVSSLTPRVRRVVLVGDDLEGFVSAGFDDHVKLFFPDAAGVLPEAVVGENGVSFSEGQPKPEGRDFTPRRYDAKFGELTIDFGLHAHGPATAWAARAVPGATVAVAGPRGSAVLSDTFDWHLLVGDDTALPAIARRLEELPVRATALVVLEVDELSEQQPLPSPASVHATWVHRCDGGENAIDVAVAKVELPAGEGFAWVAGEASMARRIRKHFIEARGLDKAWVKAAAYWKLGATGKHEVLAD